MPKFDHENCECLILSLLASVRMECLIWCWWLVVELCWWEAAWRRKKVLNFDALLTLTVLVFGGKLTNAPHLT